MTERRTIFKATRLKPSKWAQYKKKKIRVHYNGKLRKESDSDLLERALERL
jgi:hypothetical protein